MLLLSIFQNGNAGLSMKSKNPAIFLIKALQFYFHFYRGSN